jgi:SAM-dependent methyltransferase
MVRHPRPRTGVRVTLGQCGATTKEIDGLDMSNPQPMVETHYARNALGDTILAALRAAGKDLDHLTIDDLSPVDEFHSGQRGATVRLARLARVSGSEDVLDVGCGIGGPSRFLASTFGCQVTGLDLTAEFIRVAEMLARRTGLARKVTYHHGDALDLPFADASFDLVWSQNAAMNIADRGRLYAEMRRVLKPAGRLAIQEVAAGPGGEPWYPTPWAKDKSISFLLTPAATREKLEGAGFRVTAWHDPTEEALEQAQARASAAESGSLPPLGIHLLIGPDFPTVSRNMLRNLQEARITLINAVLERAR